MYCLTTLIVSPIFLSADQEFIFTASFDNLLYYASHSPSTGDTVYQDDRNGVGRDRDASMNEYWVWESLIWFDLSIIEGKVVKSAKLVLKPGELAHPDAYYDTYYQVRVVYDWWNPYTVTSNNQPRVYSEYALPFDVPTTPVSISLDVTDPVKYWTDGTIDNYGFKLEDGGGLINGSYAYATMFDSIEIPGNSAPRLIVTIEGGGNVIVPTVIAPLLLLE